MSTLPHPRRSTASTLRRAPQRLGAALLTSVLLTSCAGVSAQAARPAAAPRPSTLFAPPTHSPGSPRRDAATGQIPALLDPHDLYAADRPGMLSPTAARARPLIYVPNSGGDSVTVIDPATYTVLTTVRTGLQPQHVTPGYDQQTLWVDNDKANSLTPIDPRTGAFGTAIPVDDPYNLYFTADGAHAVVVAEQLQELDFRDPHTMALQHRLQVPCNGVDHMDFSADGTHALVSCEFGAKMIWVDMVHQSVLQSIALPAGSMPQDVKTSPDGHTFYVADMVHGGLYTLDAETLAVTGFITTGSNAHGIYVSRDSKNLYVSNRRGQSVSVVSVATNTVTATWPIPGGTPDMGGISADGTVLWLAGRYSGEVYALDTTDGHLLGRIKVGSQPHGICVWPQPGRYSLGHTGLQR